MTKNKFLNFYVFFFALFFSTTAGLAQRILTGKVLDSNTKEPLIGANVTEYKNSNGTTTDLEGNFSLQISANTVQLEISYVGYMTQLVTIDDRKDIQILLEAGESLEEVVVVGYGTQKKISMTSSVSQIKGSELIRRPVSNLQQALQGQAPGLTVLDRGGEPGRSSATMRIRGITTFSGNNSGNSSPLIIVDGVEQTLFNINPEDVENISVLKDASSTAIYGSRAANGVILVTTKRGKSGKMQITYNGFYGMQESTNDPKMMAIEDYMNFQVVGYKNQGLAIPARFTEQSIKDYTATNADRLKFPLPNTWFQDVLKPAPQQSHSLSFSGGNEFSRTRVSLRYMDQGGIAPNHDAKIREVRINNDLKINEKLDINFDLNYRYNYSQRPFRSDIFNFFLHGSLWAVPKYDDGSYGLSPQNNNPLMFAEQSGYNNISTNYLFGSTKLDYKIVKDLTFTAQLSGVMNYEEVKTYQNAYRNVDAITGRSLTVANNSLTEGRNRYTELTTNYFLNYSKKLNKNLFKGLIGFSEVYNQGSNISAYRERFYNNDIQSLGQGTNDATRNNGGSEYEFGLRSVFARLNYSFADKYLLEVNGRYDGSSRFASENQYSFFPSFSGAWRISEEGFFKNANLPFDEFKLRGSWGQTGNQTVPLYSYFASLNSGSYTFGGAAAQVFSQTSLADRTITWETNNQTDIGIEGQMLNGRVNFTADYYKKRTNGILLALPLAAVTGFTSSTQNAGVIDNEGWEFSLGYNSNPQGVVKFRFSGNMAINNNTVVDLKGSGPFISGSDLDPRYIVKEGLPFNSFWGYKTDGLFQSAAEIAAYPTIAANTKPGDVKYLDLNNDKKITADDMTNIGNPFPKYTFGFNSDISYKQFTLNILFQGAAKVDTRLSGALAEMGIFEGFAHEIFTNNYWTPENPNALFPLPRKSDQRNVNTSDRQIIDGSYLRLKNLQLIYTLSPKLCKAVNISQGNIYFSGTNLLTFSNLNKWDLDPEVDSGRGTYYPQTRMWTLGVNLTF